MSEYGMSPGPVRLDTTLIKDVDPNLAQGIRAYPGAIEIVGTPDRDTRKAIGSALVSKPSKTRKGR